MVGDASSKAGKGKAKPLQAWPSNKQEPKAAKVGACCVLGQLVVQRLLLLPAQVAAAAAYGLHF